MSVRLDGSVIRLEGRCRVEDAEPLLRHLLALDAPVVDVAEASHLHSAVVQVLIAARPPVRGQDPQSFLGRWILAAGETE